MLHLSVLPLVHLLVAPLPTVDLCPGVSADENIMFGANTDADAVDTYGRGWSAAPRKCRRFVVDFAVASDAKGEHPFSLPTFRLFGGIPLDLVPTAQAACTALSVSTTTYKKASGAAAFTKLGSYVQKGSWSSNRCKLIEVSGAPSFSTPNPAGTDVYRVAVSSSTPMLGARAKIAFDQQGPG